MSPQPNNKFISQTELDSINARAYKTEFEKMQMINNLIENRKKIANKPKADAKEKEERIAKYMPKVAEVATGSAEDKARYAKESQERKAKEEAIAKEAAEASRKQKVDENLKKLCLPPKYADAKFEPMSDFTKLKENGFENGVLVDGLKKTVQRQAEFKAEILKFNEGRVIPFSAFVFGGTGVGKTAIIAGYAKEVIKAGYTARFVTAEEFYGIWSDRISNSGHAVKDAMIELNKIKSCDLLIVDDVLKFKLTDFEFKQLTNLLDSRHNDMKETILTSNKTAKQFLKAVGDLQDSRIRNGSFMSFSFGEECFDIRPFEKRVVRW